MFRLRKLFPRSSAKRISKLLGRTESSIRRQAKILFRQPRKVGSWSEEDDLVLRRAYGVVELAAIALVVSRPVGEIRLRMKQLRGARSGTPWTAEELALLKELFGSRRDEDLEVCLSRSGEEVADAAMRLCLAKDKAEPGPAHGSPVRMPRWSVQDVDTLARLYPHRENLEIARILGRSAISVANKAHKMGLKKTADNLAEMGRRNVSIRYRG